MGNNNTIKNALYHRDWNFGQGSKRILKQNAELITLNGYKSDYKGHIFCPECCAPLFRSPSCKQHARNGRKAYFAHNGKYNSECSLRSQRVATKSYLTEQEAKLAIRNEELIIVKGFIQEKLQAINENLPNQYASSMDDSKKGGLVSVPVGKEKGQSFNLPSRMGTIVGLCRNFDKNYYKYIHLPQAKDVRKLKDLLVDIRKVTKPNNIAQLYFGRVTKSFNCGKTSSNIRQTMFEYKSNYDCKDFCLKGTDKLSQGHGIDDESTDKIVIMYGKVTISGVGLCVENVSWGEFAVLPKKYVYLLDKS